MNPALFAEEKSCPHCGASNRAWPKVSVLFADPLGPYPRMVADWWDEIRDARKYPGTNPVVAHPPCQLWGPFAAGNFTRWGGEHNRPGADDGCFAAALSAVNKWDGVLEVRGG